MKNFSKTIAAISMSLMTVGVMAQTPIAFKQTTKKAVAMSGAELKYFAPHHSKKNAQVLGINNALIDYLDGDATYAVISQMTRWSPALYMNMNYSLKDTVTSPLSSSTANADLAHYCTVTFDTLYDLYTANFDTPIQAGSVAVDTIQVAFAYHNTSNANDTVIFQVNAVDANGFPTATVYGVDTVFLNASTLTYNSFDSVQFVNIIPATPIAVPAHARHGWNFCINMMVIGSKLDTVGVWYYSQFSACTGFGINPAFTAMGVKDGTTPAVNSFVTGNQWNNSADFGGNGSVETWPNTPSGPAPGHCGISNGSYFYGFSVLNSCTDTNYYYEQDLGIFPSITYNSALGVNNIAASGLSVGQNYPNPFNKETTISYSLTKSSNVTFTVYDMAGRIITTNNYGNVAAGQYQVNLSANTFSPGIYFYTFNVNGSTVTKKMVITE